MFEIEYELREEDLVHFNELQLKNSPEIQKNIRKNRVFVPAILLLVGLFYYVYYVDIKTTIYISFLAFGWAFISPYAMKMDMRRQLLEKYTDQEKKDIFGLHTLSIEQEHLFEKSPSGNKHKTPWKDMLRVDYLEKYVHIFIDLNSAIIIPKETVKNGSLQKFAKQAESMIERLGE